MGVGRFIAGVAALIWSPKDKRYLLLRRSAEKDFAAGAWECVTGRVDQGEGFGAALHREVREELGVGVEVDFLIGTTHFYRGEERPENELLGVAYCCSLEDTGAVQISAEHSEHRWVNAEEAEQLLTTSEPSIRWIRRLIARAEVIRRHLPPTLIHQFRQTGFELD